VELSSREAAFVDAFVGEAEGNATRAAELAGHKCGPGLSVTATRIMARPHVKAAIAARQAASADLFEPESEADQGEYWRRRSCTVPERRWILSKWARHPRMAVTAIRAIDTLNRMDGVYVEKHEHAVLTPKPVYHEHAGAELSPSLLPPQGESASDP
jgi:hypothetical protein